MKKFQIFRPDLNKVLLRDVDAEDSDHAVGLYISMLMFSGMIAMSDSAAKPLPNGRYSITTTRGLTFEVEAQPL